MKEAPLSPRTIIGDPIPADNPFGLQMDGYSYAGGNAYNRLKYSGKELDEEQGLYKYHGACPERCRRGWRDYYPELGRWVVVDPARQFASGYVYGGNNPMLYYDPNGLWSIGLGFVFGYDDRGWHFGYGAAFDFDLEVVDIGLNASRVWHDDGSNSVNFSVGGGFNFGIVGADANIGYTNNSISGESFNAYAGANIVAVGAGLGYYSDDYGSSFSASGYLGIPGIASIGGGYQNGQGTHYTGWYGESTLLSNSWRNYGNGWSYSGFQQNINLMRYEHPTQNHADLITGGNPQKFEHNSIRGEYNNENFKISVGTNAGLLSAFLLSTSDQTGESHYDGSPVRLVGARMGKLYQFSKFITFLNNNNNLLPYNAIFLNCSFYTSLALNYAGIKNYYMVIPKFQGMQLELTNGRGF